MENITRVTISNTNLAKFFPRRWSSGITYIDLSCNNLGGGVTVSLTRLPDLKFLNVSYNLIEGTLLENFGDLLSLEVVSFSKNSISSLILESVYAIP